MVLETLSLMRELKKKNRETIKKFFKEMRIAKGTESCRHSLSDRDWVKAAILNKRVKELDEKSQKFSVTIYRAGTETQT